MRFIGLVGKNLLRRPARSALTLIALTTAIAAVVSLLGIARGFTESFGEIYEAHAVDIVVSRQGAADRLSSSIDAEMVSKIDELESVRHSAAVLLETMSLEEEGVYGIPTMGIAWDSWLIADFKLTGSDQIDRDGSPMKDAGSTLLGIHLAERLGLSAGDDFELFGDAYRVAGVFQSPSTWENGALVMRLDDLQELTDRDGQATYINVVLQPPLSAPQSSKAIQSIKALDEKLLPLATNEFVETDRQMQLAQAMAWMISVIALVIGAIGTLNTMLTSVMERTREIGILRAIGWPKSRVMKMILLESCGLALGAGILGTILAIWATWALSQAPAAKGILNPSIGTSVIIQGFLLAIGIGLLGALLPAWRATKLTPTEAFREQ
ncbi:MAG: ABC transporter permease [Aureliella sp.]